MKNIFVSSFIAAILASISSISYAAPATTTGTVQFKGRIIDSACTIDGDSDKIVHMGTYIKSDIKEKGREVDGSKKDFKIKLTGCPVDSTTHIMMKVTISGTSDVHNSKLLAIESSSGAKGIGIGVYSESNLIDFTSGSHQLKDIEIDKADTEIPLQVAYVSNGETPTAGQANATLNFNIAYK
ncbi:major type 1 subunit fimbrin (pilin) [Xenorhabdus cabanillasii]|uniref:Major type 1 subunit fimbrin (Pilin) n=1 Tax=Xenorhabdus cabanillasii TaxID=351673 RepID=A0A3D9UFU6_9GAMM|nr:fimbrial protein [Xenorhabdus cabanillasii]REF28332.1 major type 1 subunit fimbrin (pilin) [Xenorhabdus cabanillasii]